MIKMDDIMSIKKEALKKLQPSRWWHFVLLCLAITDCVLIYSNNYIIFAGISLGVLLTCWLFLFLIHDQNIQEYVLNPDRERMLNHICDLGLKNIILKKRLEKLEKESLPTLVSTQT